MLSREFSLLALLAMALVPAYFLMQNMDPPRQQDMPDPAQVISEGLELAEDVKLAVSSFYYHYGRFPDSNRQAGVSRPEKIVSKNVSSVTVSDGGRIIITYRQDLFDKRAVVVLEPELNGNPVWVDWQWDMPETEGLRDSRSAGLAVGKKMM